MIITKSEPFTKNEIIKLQEEYGDYIKTVIDLDEKKCSAGMKMHFEGEAILIKEGAKQSKIWGGGIDLENKIIDFNSLINIRSHDNNPSNQIQDMSIRETYEKISIYFFKEVFDE